MQQWEQLVETYELLGHDVEIIESVPGAPDMVFSANSAVVDGGRVLTARFRHPERAPEQRPYRRWFARRGFREVRAARAICEGEGDVTFVGSVALVQSGLGRTGQTFACDHEGVRPDLYVLGKALGGGIVPLSAVVGSHDVLGVLSAGTHGSTFGGNPLACAIGRDVIAMLRTGEYQDRSARLGAHLHARVPRAAQARRDRGSRPGALGRPRPRRPHAGPAHARRGRTPPTGPHQRGARARLAARATARHPRCRPRLGTRPGRRGHRDGVVGSMNKEKGTR